MRKTGIYILLGSVILLSVFGLIMLYSTTVNMRGEQLLKRQMVWHLLGIVVATWIYYLGYHRIEKWLPILLGGTTLVLFYLAGLHVLSWLGVSSSILRSFPLVSRGATKGAFRWLSLGGINVQPSEFARLVIIFYLANYYGRNPRYAASFYRGILIPLSFTGALLGAILLSGSLSITAITGSVVMVMLFLAGIRLRYFIAFFIIGGGLFYAAVKISPERLSRLTTYRYPYKYRHSSCYQLYHSRLAMASGYWHGVGFNKSRMKEFYLPEAHNDFILAIVGEELGFFAVAGVLFFFLLAVGGALLIAATAGDGVGRLLATGIGVAMGLGAFINIGVVSGALPTTGITAPFISYGGSSLLASWMGIGLLVSIWKGGSLVEAQNSGTANRRKRRESALLPLPTATG